MIPLVSAKLLWALPSLLGLSRLGQVSQVSGSQVGLDQGDQVSASPILVYLPPGSRADMSDESLMVGVGRSP